MIMSPWIRTSANWRLDPVPSMTWPPEMRIVGFADQRSNESKTGPMFIGGERGLRILEYVPL